MELETIQATVEQAGPAAIAVGFLTGFLFSFNPVALAAIPVSAAYVTRAQEPRRVIAFGAMFVLGMIVTHGALGLGAALGGAWIGGLFGRGWGLVLGPLLIVLGLVWAGWLRIPLPALPLRARRAGGPWGAFALGVPFSVAVCPACTPVLAVLLGVVAVLGAPLFGLVLLLAFAAGRAVPVMLGAFAVGLLERLKFLAGSQRALEIAGGLVLILSGLYMLNAYYIWIPSLAV